MSGTGAKWRRVERPKARRKRRLPAVLAAVALCAAGALAGTAAWFHTGVGAHQTVDGALASELRRGDTPAGVAAFYEARAYRPLWITDPGAASFPRRPRVRPEAAKLALMVGEQRPEERDRLQAAIAAAAGGAPDAGARAEVALSRALADHVRRGGVGVAPARLVFFDPALPDPADARATLEQAAAAPSLDAHLFQLRQGNLIHRQLREGLRAYRAEWSSLPRVAVPRGPALAVGADGARVGLLRVRLGLPARGGFDEPLRTKLRRFQSVHGLAPTGVADAATVDTLNRGPAPYEALIAANAERARVLPSDLGRRFVLVNVPAGELTLYADGRPVGSMRALVGKADDPTPPMAGLIRQVVFNPYWNIPVDLVRESVAPKVLHNGIAAFEAQGLEALSDWTDQAVVRDPRGIDWRAVAAGREELRVRQKPGPSNMMGAMKFLLPNELGIYLHDTPDKALFDSGRRLVSAGCIRVERAADLARWLLGRVPADLAGGERAIDLAAPVPVYILYLTAAPGPDGVVFHPDVYRRDPALLAAMAAAQ